MGKHAISGLIYPICRELTLKLMKIADENWDFVVHDCQIILFARGLNLRSRGGWFSASDYACEFPRI